MLHDEEINECLHSLTSITDTDKWPWKESILYESSPLEAMKYFFSIANNIRIGSLVSMTHNYIRGVKCVVANGCVVVV